MHTYFKTKFVHAWFFRQFQLCSFSSIKNEEKSWHFQGEELGLSNGDNRQPTIVTDDTDFFGGDIISTSEINDDITNSMNEMRMNATPSPQLFLNHPKVGISLISALEFTNFHSYSFLFFFIGARWSIGRPSASNAADPGLKPGDSKFINKKCEFVWGSAVWMCTVIKNVVYLL